MSLTLKLSSLAIRTLSKPIANQIKAQAREHERFRNVCVSMAQALHRFDMRLRLGSIRDTSASQRQAAAEAEVKKHATTSPTVKTQVETKAEEEAIEKAKKAAEEAAKPRHYRIRPLSESKAIESGANFISETFLFMVAGGLILFESWRSRRKETTRRDGVEERLAELEQSEKTAIQALVALEKELLALKAKHGESPKSTHHILPREVWEAQPEVEEPAVEETWWTKATSYFSFGQSASNTAPTAPAIKTSQSPDTRQVGQPAVPAGQTQPSATKSS
ncbi:uncharacterized protein N7443_003249 [Penicillium atrosanguineum]|uniref:OPA3-like protein n=1 Tax=Penicillium atrosanguineum TaxID=1132637 RepID=A0A9W9Q0Y1_9EURO|nr:uncharacterized protein N7443_003249 [Penicillium atrosanguineum]KAJ5118069.1 hypothetical protein N7526_011092 [Penicillium atrosanguineum]KAJ5310788.1 hypothetical protein N7443_003249 [Penicillium atrosanguineum]KAJ5316312.1 hypothetical protein N7476_006619 [Penicillium atrosanguineum]